MAELDEVTEVPRAENALPVKMIVLVLFAAVFLVALTVVGMFFMLKATGMLGAPGVQQPGAAALPSRPAIYHPLEPAFVVNINDHGRMRYLQVEMEIMTRDPAIVDEVKNHTPLIRNNLVLLLSSQTVEKLSSPEGKEEIRQRALEEVQNVLQNEIGETGVEAIYITSLVIQ